MSALAGILNFNGAPVHRTVLDALAHSLAKHGPDSGAHKQTANVGIVVRGYHTDSKSRLDRQPLVSIRGLILAWDGRLDNRSDLLSQLDDCPDRLFTRAERCFTDAELVMASYLKWGADFLPRLIGDFALSLWDPESRTLLLARDAFGVRPMYYQVSPQRLIWSSALATVVDFSALPIEVDHQYVAAYLGNTAETSRTAYKNIDCVPPGSAVIVCEHRVENRAFWRPDSNPKIRYRNDSEYEEHFRDLFRESVRCRLRSNRPVWAELSGGLDSSSIVCIADELIESGEAETAQLETVSYVYDRSAGSDERRFIYAVEEKRGRAGHHFHEDDSVGRFQDLDLTEIVRPNPIYRFTARHAWVRARMQETGSCVLLSGVGGDNLLWSGAEVSPEPADLLVRLKLRSLHRQVLRWSRATGDSYAGTLSRGAFAPLLKQPWSFTLPSVRAQRLMLGWAISAVANCYYRDRVPTEYRFPFFHRPLVEFLLAVPIGQKLRPTQNRSLQRRALKHLLPPAVLRRQSKRWPTEALCRTLAKNWSDVAWLFHKPRVCEYGFVNADAFTETAKRVRHGLQNAGGELSLVLSVELWLRALELRRSPALPEVKLAS